MITRLLIALLLSGPLITIPAWSQSDEIASERSRVADERIRIEAERMAQEEKRRAEEGADAERLSTLEAQKTEAPPEVEPQDIIQPQPDVIPATVATSETAPHSGGETGRLGMSLMLEHLNVLGQLRDSGYVTEAEFERIKQRILEGEL
ncbi:MAG: SHOCT domain-containing protein [Woeseiaceae bacterium]|nr:SHOCT domain-containing protein [Woeseiaceae bacterium]